jgi:glycerophosphoryl diester phosphodiesterase
LRTLSYTVNVEESARRLLALGIDGIITDRIDLFGPAD